jgi:hypothetical protein
MWVGLLLLIYAPQAEKNCFWFVSCNLCELEPSFFTSVQPISDFSSSRSSYQLYVAMKAQTSPTLRGVTAILQTKFWNTSYYRMPCPSADRPPTCSIACVPVPTYTYDSRHGRPNSSSIVVKSSRGRYRPL